MGHDDETLCRRPNRELGFSCSKSSDNRKSTIAAIDHHIPIPTTRRFRSEKCYFDFQRCLKVHPSGNSGYPPERRSDGALLDHVCELRRRRHPRPRRWALLLTRRRLTRDDAFRYMSQHGVNVAYDPGCVKTLRGITVPGILGPVVMRRAKKHKNLSSARHYDQIGFRFRTAKTQSGGSLQRNGSSGIGAIPDIGDLPGIE